MRYNVDSNYVDIKCPYFGSETEMGLNCEGCLKGSIRTKTTFKSCSEKKAFIVENCLHYPNGCAISRANDNKYE